MFRRFSVNFAIFSILFDTALIYIALVISVHFRPSLSILPFAEDIRYPLQIPSIIYPLFPLVWVAILLLFSVYDGRRNLHISDELASLTLGSILAAVSLAGSLYLSFRDTSRILFLSFVSLAFLFLVTWRIAARAAFRLGKGKPASSNRVLIVGAGQVGRELEKKIREHTALGLSVVGFLDDDPVKQVDKQDVVGAVSDIREVVINKNISDVVIALPQRAHEEINRLVAELHVLPVKVWVIPDYFHLALHKAVVEDFAGIPLFDLRAPALDDYQRMVKRLFDLIVTFSILPFSLPLMGLIAIAIRIEGPGPILFRQVRVGENGRLFKMLKFRTMVPNAEDLRHLVERVDVKGRLIHKSSTDPRVTGMGNFLRKTSMDELPQLFNVIKGDMSVIGPRPELPYLVEKYEPWQRKRFAVPQGITGWWQINGRSDKPMHLNTEDDLYYVHNYSIQLDILILIRTIWVVLRGKGAY
ncbi:MAG: sugar transferase [Omnitrophica WOR_2 bacterium]